MLQTNPQAQTPTRGRALQVAKASSTLDSCWLVPYIGQLLLSPGSIPMGPPGSSGHEASATPTPHLHSFCGPRSEHVRCMFATQPSLFLALRVHCVMWKRPTLEWTQGQENSLCSEGSCKPVSPKLNNLVVGKRSTIGTKGCAHRTNTPNNANRGGVGPRMSGGGSTPEAPKRLPEGEAARIGIAMDDSLSGWLTPVLCPMNKLSDVTSPTQGTFRPSVAV